MTSPTVTLQIRKRPIDELKPYSRNARTHSASQVEQIAHSIREFGLVNPILVAEDGTVIAGHARLQAAMLLEMKEVPVIVLAHLSPKQRRALVMADNQLALNAGWDEALLGAELAALEKEPFDLHLIGFNEAELDRLRAEVLKPEPRDPDALPELPESAVSRAATSGS